MTGLMSASQAQGDLFDVQNRVPSHKLVNAIDRINNR